MKNVTNYILRSDGEEFAHVFKVKSIMVLHTANRISRAKLILLDGDVSEQKFALSDNDFFKPGIPKGTLYKDCLIISDPLKNMAAMGPKIYMIHIMNPIDQVSDPGPSWPSCFY